MSLKITFLSQWAHIIHPIGLPTILNEKELPTSRQKTESYSNIIYFSIYLHIKIKHVHIYKLRTYADVFTEQRVVHCVSWRHWGVSARWSSCNDDRVPEPVISIHCAETSLDTRAWGSASSCARKSVRVGSAETLSRLGLDSGTPAGTEGPYGLVRWYLTSQTPAQ